MADSPFAGGGPLVDVGGFGAAVARFRGVDPVGRVVLVVGPAGGGKSAVVGWCVEWLRGGHDTVVVDLSGLALPLAVRERIDAVCVRLAELTGVRPAEPRGVFDEIEVGWPEDRLLVVLLPPIELPAELAWYVGAVRERVVVFAESAHLDGGAAVTLRVRALEPGEVGRYVASRGVRVADAAVAGIERVYAPIGLTVGVLRRLLHEVWARRDRDGTAIGLDEIAAVQRKRLLEP